MSARKDIIIFGCPRSGKTTLATMLQNELNYQIISLDSLVYTFEHNFPQVEINRKGTFREKSRKIVPFINRYIKNYKLDYPNQNFIIEGCQIMPCDILQTFDRRQIECICLGYPNANIKNILDNIRKNDEKMLHSYSKKIVDYELVERIAVWIRFSKILKKESIVYGIPFYETDNDREVKLNNICKKIITDVLEKEEEK